MIAVGEAARMLGVSPDTVKRYEKDGLIRAVRTPRGHRRFSRTAVERLVQKAHADAAKGEAKTA